jgi:esterase/lipase
MMALSLKIKTLMMLIVFSTCSSFVSAFQVIKPNTANLPAENSQVSGTAVKIAIDEQLSLAGQYFSGDVDGAGVLLLHDCQHSATSYQALAQALSAQGIHALALDMRGYGASVSDKFSHQTIQQNTQDLISYQGQVAWLMSFWQKDVLLSYQYLQSKLQVSQQISIVTSGCSANQAVYLADNVRINSMVMLTPEMSYADKERYKNLMDLPVFFASSVHQTDSMNNAKELFLWNGDKRSVMKVYKGDRTGHRLLSGKSSLYHDIALWLASNLNR